MGRSWVQGLGVTQVYTTACHLSMFLAERTTHAAGVGAKVVARALWETELLADLCPVLERAAAPEAQEAKAMAVLGCRQFQDKVSAVGGIFGKFYINKIIGSELGTNVHTVSPVGVMLRLFSPIFFKMSWDFRRGLYLIREKHRVEVAGIGEDELKQQLVWTSVGKFVPVTVNSAVKTNYQFPTKLIRVQLQITRGKPESHKRKSTIP